VTERGGRGGGEGRRGGDARRCASPFSGTTRTSARRGPFTEAFARFGELINRSQSTGGNGGRGGNFVRTKPHRDKTTPGVRSSPRLNLFTIGPFNELHFGTWTRLGASTRESPRNHAGWSASRGVRDDLTRIEFTSPKLGSRSERVENGRSRRVRADVNIVALGNSSFPRNLWEGERERQERERRLKRGQI